MLNIAWLVDIVGHGDIWGAQEDIESVWTNGDIEDSKGHILSHGRTEEEGIRHMGSIWMHLRTYLHVYGVCKDTDGHRDI